MAEKHSKGIKRYGVRYGRTTKRKLGALEATQKKSHQCPQCRYETVKRQSAGIWHCSKCNMTFTSKAYNIVPPPPIKREEEQVI